MIFIIPECQPGEKFNEECNVCICGYDGVPECSKKLCIGYKETQNKN